MRRETTPSGTRFQSGIPFTQATGDGKARGLLVRGVVTATYVTDDAGHPRVEDGDAEGAAIYCDVMVYPSIPGRRFLALKQVLVSQEVSGLHRGRIWKPRACSLDWVDDLDMESGSNPAYVDGDHVLVGFLNDNLNQPIILRALPHPSVDLGREDRDSGQRMKLKLADGDPDFIRHHGTHFGINDDGDFMVDSTFANDGELGGDGKEADPPTDGKGGQTFKLSKDATHQIVLYDMSNPASPNEVMKVLVDKDKLQVKVTQGDTLKAEEDGADAKLTVGNGAVPLAVASRLETLYNALKTQIDAAFNIATGHVHGGGTGPGGNTLPPIAAVVLNPWDPQINSDKVTCPDTSP